MRLLPRRTRALARDVNVCRSCRQQQQLRSFATSPSPPPPPPSGIAPLSSRRLISVAGPDAAKFLQGIVTADVTARGGLPRSDGFYTAFLTATGRVLFDVFVYPNHGTSPDEPGFLIEVDADQAAVLTRHIKRYKLRAKLAVRLLGADEATVWHGWDDTQTPGSSNWDAVVESTPLAFKDPRVPGLGYRFARLDDKAPEVDLERSTQDAYTIRRYLHGVAEGQSELAREHSLPQESNMDVMNGIDWRKGCYVGQELTIRTRHRGVVRKRVLPCVIAAPEHATPAVLQYQPAAATTASDGDELGGVSAEQIPRQTSIGRLGKRGRSAGKWLGGVGNIGLGLCRLEIMTDLELPGETAAAAFNPEDEFKLEWGEEGAEKSMVKVKAFVPEWLRRGLKEESGHH